MVHKICRGEIGLLNELHWWNKYVLTRIAKSKQAEHFEFMAELG